MSSTQPEVVVGIDFGMTFTGVAYWRRDTGMQHPRVIQKWPGRLEITRKVPSVLHYPATGGDPEWGFPCQYAEHKEEWFKRFLDADYLEHLRANEPEGGVPTVEEVRKWYRDYMRGLFTYINRYLQDQMGSTSWSRLKVEFIFSLPTTFRSQEITTSLRGLLVDAGFGQGAHTIEFGLTEPQASAVDAAKDTSKTFHSGDVILVCDAGGGTTDVALLEQTSGPGTTPELQELTNIPGIDIGSTNIDLAFEELVENRLEAGGLNLAENTSWTMMHSQEFQMWKCSFGDPSTEDVPRFLITVPFLGESVTNREAGIEGGKMGFTRADFSALFEPQVVEILKLIRKQLDFMQRNYIGKYVNYLILSGGLGSSPYLLSRLRSEFEQNSHPAAPSLEILLSEEPQLAVCRGLVIDRMQKVTTRRNVLVGRVCPASYGVLCRVPYNKNDPQHINQETYKHPIYGVPWVRNQVHWILKKGQMVDIDTHIAHKFTRLICSAKDVGSDDTNKKIWTDSIIISHADADRLPAECAVLCHVTSDLSALSINDFEVRKEQKPWYKTMGSKEKWWVADHQIKLLIGSTDIKFELWYKGTPYTRPNGIRVDWQEGAAISPPNDNRRLEPNILRGVGKRNAIRNNRNKERTANNLRRVVRSPEVGSPWLGTSDRERTASSNLRNGLRSSRPRGAGYER